MVVLKIAEGVLTFIALCYLSYLTVVWFIADHFVLSLIALALATLAGTRLVMFQDSLDNDL